jgi:hypothetical protein
LLSAGEHSVVLVIESYIGKLHARRKFVDAAQRCFARAAARN